MDAEAFVGPPKLGILNNTLLAAGHPDGPPHAVSDRLRFGRWIENACLARAWNAGEQVTYWGKTRSKSTL